MGLSMLDTGGNPKEINTTIKGEDHLNLIY